ncbi:hypothetical protein RvY_14628 [Ramazzottius varieornatus]|uniref:Ephrin RBD domain-containing protein n=1 Tax=Ramazzottius varieornatus TaxID=947166 RepID=A0A1D1VTM1_RAMVA|nr:hypothetical protein RvY_14628 [Ramazzottius varieornatus]
MWGEVVSSSRRRQCRKRDDIRSSGCASSGETSNVAQACPNKPQTFSSPPSSPVFRCISTCLRYYCLILVLFDQGRRASAIQLPDVYWNSSNPIFRIDNTDHIIDVNKSPQEYDRVNIYCPRFPRHQSGGVTTSIDAGQNKSGNDGYYIIYNVSKEEYESCSVTNPSARRMVVCDNPSSDRLSYVTITFRPYSPTPNGPEFHAGHDYYFITTSTGTEAGLDNKFGGRCSSHNMRLVFKVAGGAETTDNDDGTQRFPPPVIRLPLPEPKPSYETVTITQDVPIVFSSPRRTHFGRRTTRRPRIINPEYTPKPKEVKEASVIDTENNELPSLQDQSSAAEYPSRPGDQRRRQFDATTRGFFNVIKEEEAAVPARQTKPAPPNSASNSVINKNCQLVMFMMISLWAVMQGMLQRV